MKKSETKVRDLKELLGMKDVPQEEFIQFIFDTVDSMPEIWADPCKRSYFLNEGQKFDENTGRPLQTDSRFYILMEHSRYGLRMLVELARKHPKTLEWLLENVK